MKPLPHDCIDLTASAARVQSARELAKAHALRVEQAAPLADRQSIDLLYLLQESVLVLSRTHTMLEKIVALDASEVYAPEPSAADRPTTDAYPDILPKMADPTVRARRQTPALVLMFLLALVVTTAAIEVIDPQPMDAEAAWIRVP